MENKPNVIFVLGGPGSGKGTHCDLIRQRYNLTHYSVGDILREFLKSGTKEAQLISQMMKEGQMVSSQTVVKSIKDKILKGDKSKKILLDGFPRNQDNITAWNNIVGDQIKVQLLIYIDVSDDAMRSRLLNRGKTSGRLDDTAEIIQKRLVTFHQETQPVLIHYKRLYAQGHFKVLNVNGEITIDVAQERIKKFFALNHIA